MPALEAQRRDNSSGLDHQAFEHDVSSVLGALTSRGTDEVRQHIKKNSELQRYFTTSNFTSSYDPHTAGADDAPLTFHDILDQERDAIEFLRQQRNFHQQQQRAVMASADSSDPTKDHAAPTATFSLAFSGGGMRAAAFQAGVLWRLAEAGVISEIEYFTAVSGGGYIGAAFVSHLLAAPKPGVEGLRAWYLDIVAKTCVRMQRNAGNFVRDWAFGALNRPADGSGLLPRIFDLPVLVFTLFLTMAINPLQFAVVYIIPATEILNIYFGAALRLAFCTVDIESGDSPDILTILANWSPFGTIVRIVEYTTLINFGIWLGWMMLCCRPSTREERERKGQRYHLGSFYDGKTWRYLLVRGLLGCLSRLILIIALALIVIFLTAFLQVWIYQGNAVDQQSGRNRWELCQDYVQALGAGNDQPMCANFAEDRPWYEAKEYTSLHPPIAADSMFAYSNDFSVEDRERQTTFKVSLIEWLKRTIEDNRQNIISTFIGLLIFTLTVSLVLTPWSPGAFLRVLSVVGPATSFVCVLSFVQHRVYGPVTKQKLLGFSFEDGSWTAFVDGCLGLASVLALFYHELQRIWHFYYLRSLQLNYFAKGKDRSFRSMLENPYCPLVIFTGTANDYLSLDTNKAIHEISFSPLHTGAEGLGYMKTPYYLTLAKCTALTGAGCLDAISLSMSTRLQYRFWLEMLNLSWGDYILFNKKETTLVKKCSKRTRYWTRNKCEGKTVWLLHRMPIFIPGFTFLGLLMSGWSHARDSADEDCPFAKRLLLASCIVITAIFMLSFFSFLPGLEFLMFSPLIRQFHKGTRYYFKGEHPPGMLYVTDGGVQDCTAIVQLMMRRCKRILLVLAAADPKDELGVLRVAMKAATDQRLGSFFDPSDPTRDVRILLEEYQQDKTQCYFELGIRYGWEGTPQDAMPTAATESELRECSRPPHHRSELGRLIVVKNRLPEHLSGKACSPLLTEAEITSEAPPGEYVKGWAETFLETHLGGLGCCNCCHRRRLNCGGKFPHLTGANYLYLTPQLFSQLCRLGYKMSEEAVNRISEKERPATRFPTSDPIPPNISI